MLREQTINLFAFARSAVGSSVEGSFLICSSTVDVQITFLWCSWKERNTLLCSPES